MTIFRKKNFWLFFCFCSTTLTLFCPNRDKYAAEDQNVKRNIEFFTNSNSYLENKLKSLKVRLPCKSFERSTFLKWERPWRVISGSQLSRLRLDSLTCRKSPVEHLKTVFISVFIRKISMLAACDRSDGSLDRPRPSSASPPFRYGSFRT